MDLRLSEEQRDLILTATRLANDRFASRAFTWRGFPWENAKVLAEAGFTGITFPIEDGGQGGSLMDAVLVMEAVSKVCPESGDAVQATNFGAIQQVATFGSPILKADVLPGLLAGDALITPGMSEPEAGSALTDLTTRARYEDGDVVLDGNKAWNSYGPDATHVVVWCRFGPRTKDIGAVVVPADAPGFSKGPTEWYMGGQSYCALSMDGCRVRRENVLCDSDGLRKMMQVFNIERIGNAVRSVALAESAFDRAVAYAKERKSFGRPLCEFQGIQWKFADMRTQLDAARLLVYRTVANAEHAPVDATDVSIAKLFANETAFAVVNQSLQVFGAIGYSTQLPIEHLLRKVRGWMIAGGSAEILRNRIAEGVFNRRFSQRPS